MNLTEAIQETIEEIDKIAKSEFPFALAELGRLVFESMGTEPTNRGWSENSENTKKKIGILGKFHRNVDTGQLMEHVSTPGALMDDGWFDALPQEYKYASNLGEFNDIGKTDMDEKYLKEKLVEAIERQLNAGK